MASVKRVTTGWRARWRTPDGESRSRTFSREIDAKNHVSTVEASKLGGAYIDQAAGRVTLAEWWVRYRAMTDKRATTSSRDRTVMEKWWLPALGHIQVAKLSPAPIRAVVDRMSESLAPATIRTNYGVLRAVLTAAVEAEL